MNGNFTPTLQTQLTDAVAALGAATGKSDVVALAAQSRTEGDARYIRRCVQLLAAGAKEVGSWTALGTSENEIEAVAADGRLVLPWSVDYMTWNEETLPAETPAVKAASKREIWTTGVATERKAGAADERVHGRGEEGGRVAARLHHPIRRLRDGTRGVDGLGGGVRPVRIRRRLRRRQGRGRAPRGAGPRSSGR